MTRYRVSYSGSDPVRLGKAGVFGPGTVAYVDEADAAEARKLAGFTVEAEGGGGVAEATPQPVVDKGSSGANAAAAGASPTPVADQKSEKKDAAPKKDEKHGGEKAEAKKDEKAAEPKKDEKKADAGASTPPAGEQKS